MTGLEPSPDFLANFPPARRYLVGVSGGRDSVVLLHWLIHHGYRRLIVCHLDHQLRDAASKGDARFVRRLTEKWELPCEIESANVRVAQGSAETAGRAARLEFFTRVARRRRCHTIFLGQHADDQVETFLLQLFRGAGGRGLGGMREISEVGALKIVRPLLGVWRAEIDAYVAAHRLKFREDATNADLGPRRNRVRRQIIPELEAQFGKNLRRNLWRTASVLAAEDSFLETLVPEEPELRVKTVRALPLVLQRRLILRWLRAHDVADVGFDLIENIRALAAPSAKSARTNLPRDRFVRRRAGTLFFE
ncbi:MAG: tRNA lysidine(34) synthetase TilS [Chthoniobacterales bacterium]